MNNLIATATVLGLLALAPAASAQEEQHNKAAPAQGARPGGAPHGQEHAPGGPGGGHNAGPAERGPARGPAMPNGGGHNGPTSERSAGQAPSHQGTTERTHGAPAVALVGSFEQVANALVDYAEVGVTQFILSGWPKLDEMILFGKEVLPRVRKIEPASREQDRPLIPHEHSNPSHVSRAI